MEHEVSNSKQTVLDINMYTNELSDYESNLE